MSPSPRQSQRLRKNSEKAIEAELERGRIARQMKGIKRTASKETPAAAGKEESGSKFVPAKKITYAKETGFKASTPRNKPRSTSETANDADATIATALQETSNSERPEDTGQDWIQAAANPRKNSKQSCG